VCHRVPRLPAAARRGAQALIVQAVDGSYVQNTAVARFSSELARAGASVTLGLFLLATVAVPAALINKVLFVLVFGFVAIAPFAAGGKVKVRSLSPLIVVTVFAYGYALSFLFETDREFANQLMLSVSLLTLVYMIDWYALDFDWLIKFAGLFLCIFSGMAFFTLLFAQGSAVSLYLQDYFLEYSQGAFGRRSFFGSTFFNFRIGTAPFLFLPYCLFFKSFLRTGRIGNVLALLLVSFVIALTTSRALIFGCMLASAYMLAMKLRPSPRVIAYCVGAVAAVVVADYLITQTDVFSATEQSNRVKIGHAVSFLEHMTPLRMLFGEGLAAFYFTSGFNASVAQTEISVLDMIRYLGLPLTAVLYGALLFPTLRLQAYRGDNMTPVVIFALYLAISVSNPVLFNSYGLLVVNWYWTNILRLRELSAPAAATDS
jgi:hypothetical protein